MTDFEAVHARLREILLKHRGELAVTKDGPGGVAIEVPDDGDWLRIQALLGR